jgi:predicted dehydrogenase/threonine dehydrogenase-like Zn-dependent dehydrogenase
MKQVFIRNGRAVVEEVPSLGAESGEVLVQVAWSCISPGTELASAAATSPANILERFRRNPPLARKAYKLFRDRGLRYLTMQTQKKLLSSKVAGYSCAGVVVEVGAKVESFSPGDRVACVGTGYANHAEIVAVPQNLVIRVPDAVGLAEASSVALGAIAMQGVRRAQVSLGERIGVIGLGFVGQLTVQLLQAAGCTVFGTDSDPTRVVQAASFGIAVPLEGETDRVAAAYRFSEGYGLDAVLLTAATPSDEPLQLAMQMTRRKGRVVVIGDVGLGIRRKEMYAKEIDLLISTSYGPGRYDSSYEEEGMDYPYAYVRWTENRNMQAYLELIARGQVNLEPLIPRRLCVAEAATAYSILQEETPRPYTVLLEYPAPLDTQAARQITMRPLHRTRDGTVRLAIVGAGAFAQNVHIPNLQKLTARFQIEAIVNRHGPAAVAVARKVGARIAATDYRDVLADPAVDAVLIATRHHLHAAMVGDALRAGKHVFVEKPLALTDEELVSLEKLVDDLTASASGCPAVFVGFNRRYSPYALRLQELVANRTTPLLLSYRMNAGYHSPDHWSQSSEGGGRVLGEACHIFDLFRFLTGAPVREVVATGVRSTRRDVLATDNFTATVRYADGSVAALLYTSQGGRTLAKESLELHADARSFVLDDYRQLRGFDIKFDLRTKRQEKGHMEELNAFHQAINGSLHRRALWDETVEVTRTTIEVDRLVRGS